MCETFKKSIAMLTVDELRQLCLLNKISGMSAAKKADLTSALSKDYTKNCESLKKLKVDELEEMCRLKKIKGFSGYKKDDLVGLIALFDMSIKDTKDVKDVKDTKDTKDSVAEPGETKEKEEKEKKEKPKKEAPKEVTENDLKRQENIDKLFERQEKRLAELKQDFKDKIFTKKEYLERIKSIEEQTNIALGKFGQGGKV